MRYCINCGRRNQEVPILKIDTLSPDCGICFNCHDELRRRGVKMVDVGHDIDEQLAGSNEYRQFLFREAAGKPKCSHCGGPTLYIGDGEHLLWCTSCERRRQQIARGIRA